VQVILAPHLDDEIIGCYSILGQVDLVVYFHQDYREQEIPLIPGLRYVHWDEFCGRTMSTSLDDVIYLPSRYDYHPLHREVRAKGLALLGKKMFYSVEMNVPWLEEEEDPRGKKDLLQKMYPGEVETISKSDKYLLFKSIQPFDEIIWGVVQFTRGGYHCWPSAPAEVEFLRYPHRHLFHWKVEVQQFGDDRDLEYFILSWKVQAWVDEQDWPLHTSCEMFALRTQRWLESTYPTRLVRVSVLEDGENGCTLDASS